MVSALKLSSYLIITTDAGINGDLICVELIDKFSFISQLILVLAYLFILSSLLTMNACTKRRNGGN